MTKIEIEIEKGMWALNLMLEDHDKVVDIAYPKKSRTFKNLTKGGRYKLAISVSAEEKTSFNIKINTDVYEFETDSENMYTGHLIVRG